MALCSDLLVIASDAKIGYPPARVWGTPTTAMWTYRLGPQRAKRLLFTGDSLSGAEALEWGLATEAPDPADLDERTETLAGRIARNPLNQLQMMKLLVPRFQVSRAPTPGPVVHDLAGQQTQPLAESTSQRDRLGQVRRAATRGSASPWMRVPVISRGPSASPTPRI